MNETPDLIELYGELYKLEEKITLLSGKMDRLSLRHEEEIGRLTKELETQKIYYSSHIKELYGRSQLPIK